MFLGYLISIEKQNVVFLLLGNSLNYSVYQKVGTGEKFDQA